jgi:hypothetical protein
MGNGYSQRKQLRDFLGSRLKCVPVYPFSQEESNPLGIFVQQDGVFQAVEPGYTVEGLDGTLKGLREDLHVTEVKSFNHTGATRSSRAMSAGLAVRLFGGVALEYESGSFLSFAVKSKMQECSIKGKPPLGPSETVARALEGKEIGKSWIKHKSIYVATSLVMCDGIAVYATKDKVSEVHPDRVTA